MTLARLFRSPSPAEPPRRIVSLVPSLTEALFAFGAGERIVGVSRFCEEPAEAVARLPRLGGTKNPDIAAIVALAPDLVIASREENRREDVEALKSAALRVVVTDFPTVDAALDGLIELAALVGGGEATAATWRERTRALSSRLSAAAPIRYFCPIWRKPYMTARRDTYMADLLAQAGGADALDAGGPLHYNAVALDVAMAARPEIILLPDEPYRFAERHLADFAPFVDVPAVANGRIVLFDGKLLTWYGPRTPTALAFFAEAFAAVRAGSEVVQRG